MFVTDIFIDFHLIIFAPLRLGGKKYLPQRRKGAKKL